MFYNTYDSVDAMLITIIIGSKNDSIDKTIILNIVINNATYSSVVVAIYTDTYFTADKADAITLKF